MTKQEIYVVTCGSYSDYSITAVYLDKAAAERRVAGENARGPYREEHRIETFLADQEPPEFAGMLWRSTWWALPANLQANYQDPAHCYEAWYEGPEPGNARVLEGEAPHYDGCDFNTRYVTVVGRSKDHVEKAANDRRQQVRAELLGIA